MMFIVNELNKNLKVENTYEKLSLHITLRGTFEHRIICCRWTGKEQKAVDLAKIPLCPLNYCCSNLFFYFIVQSPPAFWCHKNPATVAICTMHAIALCSHTTNSAFWIQS